MKKWTSILLVALMLLGLCACATCRDMPGPDDAPDEEDGTAPLAAVTPVYPTAIDFDDYDGKRANREDNAVEEHTTAAVNDFACRISSALLAEGGNACCSPMSLYYALALAATGAGGETQTELLALLGFDDAETLAKQCGKLFRLSYTDDGVSQLKLANSLWLDGDFGGTPVSFRQDWLDGAAANFYAAVYQAQFGTAGTDQAMSRWVSDNTGGKLAPEFETTDEMIMAIINTVYFYDEWTDAFQESATAAADFHLAGGGTVTADFMNRGSSGGFAAGETFTRASLPLKSNGSMSFILPAVGVDAAALLADPEALNEALFGGEECYGSITWSIPKFHYGSQFTPMEALKALGVTSAFAEGADFSGITDQDCWISQVEHGTYISINEKGVEAAAYTELGYAGAGMPQDHADMILDRPFLYAITDANGELLFVGICADPSAN